METNLFEGEIEDLDSTSFNESNTVVIERLNERIRATSTDILQANANVSGISLDELKKVATHFGMSKNLAKSKLVKEIKQKLDN